jgi:hypothetical protein
MRPSGGFARSSTWGFFRDRCCFIKDVSSGVGKRAVSGGWGAGEGGQIRGGNLLELAFLFRFLFVWGGHAFASRGMSWVVVDLLDRRPLWGQIWHASRCLAF